MPSLEHHAGQNHRARGGGIGVRVGKPSVYWEQWHLHRERNGEREENPPSCGGGQRLVGGDLDQVEGDGVARLRRMEEREARGSQRA